MGNFGRVGTVEDYGTQRNIACVILIGFISVFIGIGEQAAAFLAAVAFAVSQAVFSNFYGTDIDREIEADCFGSCEAQEVATCSA